MAKTETLTDRQEEIQAIVDAAYDRKWAETDRHGHVVGSWPALCKCGFTPKPASRNHRVSVGVHIHDATRKAEKACQAEIEQRVTETRRTVR